MHELCVSNTSGTCNTIALAIGWCNATRRTIRALCFTLFHKLPACLCHCVLHFYINIYWSGCIRPLRDYTLARFIPAAHFSHLIAPVIRIRACFTLLLLFGHVSCWHTGWTNDNWYVGMITYNAWWCAIGRIIAATDTITAIQCVWYGTCWTDRIW